MRVWFMVFLLMAPAAAAQGLITQQHAPRQGNSGPTYSASCRAAYTAYLQRYPDVAEEARKQPLPPLDYAWLHYRTRGQQEGRVVTDAFCF